MASTSSKTVRPAYHCTECGNTVSKWHGRCPECHAWGSITEVGPVSGALRKVSAGVVTTPARRLADINSAGVTAKPSGIGELDRVLGGGLIPGSVILLAGEPGVGKSTLLLAAAQSWAAAGNGAVLIVTGEESAEQVRLRAGRIGALHPDVYLAAETELSAALAHVEAVAPTLLIVDSVQTIAAAEIDGSAGGVTQVRAVAAALTAIAKQRNIATVLVGHVTKDGAIAGPRVLEHLVDVVLHFEGDRTSSLRLVRGVKNRFGPSDEVGCFQMAGNGIVSLADPSGLFLSARRASVPGTCATITIEGRRALPAEIQTLTTKSEDRNPRRAVSGLATPRVDMVIAVLMRWGGVPLSNADIMVATVGGAKILEPAADLAMAMALWSAVRDIPLSKGLVVMGELGLSADIRPITGVNQRLAEASRLGFDHAVIPRTPDLIRPKGMRVDDVDDLGEAFRALGNDTGVVHWLQSRRRESAT